jgi:hypothetical protein
LDIGELFRSFLDPKPSSSSKFCFKAKAFTAQGELDKKTNYTQNLYLIFETI